GDIQYVTAKSEAPEFYFRREGGGMRIDADVAVELRPDAEHAKDHALGGGSAVEGALQGRIAAVFDFVGREGITPVRHALAPPKDTFQDLLGGVGMTRLVEALSNLRRERGEAAAAAVVVINRVVGHVGLRHAFQAELCHKLPRVVEMTEQSSLL